MQIEDWLQKHKMSVVDLAERLEVTRQTVYGWINLEFLPSAQKLMDLYEITEGEVSLEDFRQKLEELQNGKSDGVGQQVREGLERRRCGGNRPPSGS